MPPPLSDRPWPHSGGAAKEGGEWRQGVLVFCPQRSQKIGESGSQREAEVRRDSPGGPGTPGEVRVEPERAPSGALLSQSRLKSHKPYPASSLEVEPFVVEVEAGLVLPGRLGTEITPCPSPPAALTPTWRRSAERLIVILLKWLMGAIVLVIAA